MDDSVKRQYEATGKELTEIQTLILEHYFATFSIPKACKLVGIDSSYVYRSLAAKGDTAFKKAYVEMTKRLETDPRIAKVGSIASLQDIADRAKEQGRLDIELKVQQEINKMVERNYAIHKTATEHINIDVKANLDLTQPKESLRIEDSNYDDDE